MIDKKQHKITNQQLSAKIPDVIKISTFGMDERSIQRISAMFAIIFKGRCELVPPEEAMIALIDVNDEGVSETIMDSSKDEYSSLPSIVLVKNSTDKTQDNVRYLEKPLKREEFWQAISGLFENQEQLKDVSKKINTAKTSKSAAQLDTLIKSDKKNNKIAKLVIDQSKHSIFYDPNKYLIGYIQKLLEKKYPSNTVLKLEFAYKYRIFLYPDKYMALCNLSESHFRNIAIMPFTNNQMCKLVIEKNADFDNDKQIYKDDFSKITLDALLWTLALRTSRGRVPEDTFVNKPVYIHSWPNFTRLNRSPHAMRIVSLWIDNPQSLNDIAVSLGIEHADVYSFYSAAYAIGIAGKSKREADVIVESKPIEPNKKRGLFSAILNRFKRKPKADK